MAPRSTLTGENCQLRHLRGLSCLCSNVTRDLASQSCHPQCQCPSPARRSCPLGTACLCSPSAFLPPLHWLTQTPGSSGQHLGHRTHSNTWCLKAVGCLLGPEPSWDLLSPVKSDYHPILLMRELKLSKVQLTKLAEEEQGWASTRTHVLSSRVCGSPLRILTL